MFSLFILTAMLALIHLGNTLTSSLQQVASSAAGPTSAGMYIYVPTTKLSLAPIIVAIPTLAQRQRKRLLF